MRRFQLFVYVVLCLLFNLRLLPGQSSTSFQVENRALSAGITFKQINFATEMKYPFETLGGAVAALDFNNDGWVDLFFLNGAPSPEHIRKDPASFNCLYQNNGNGKFLDVTQKSGLSRENVEGCPQGLAIGDYNNDGFVDIFVTQFGDNLLYHNNGDGTFRDVTAKAGVAMSLHPFKASACWVDIDNDGWLDLFVTHYFSWTFQYNSNDYWGEHKPGYRTCCTPDVFKPLPNVLFHNNRDGTFTDISEKAGLSLSLGKGMGVAIADYDGDGWIFLSPMIRPPTSFIIMSEMELSKNKLFKPAFTPMRVEPWSQAWDVNSTITTMTAVPIFSMQTWCENSLLFSRIKAEESLPT